MREHSPVLRLPIRSCPSVIVLCYTEEGRAIDSRYSSYNRPLIVCSLLERTIEEQLDSMMCRRIFCFKCLIDVRFEMDYGQGAYRLTFAIAVNC